MRYSAAHKKTTSLNKKRFAGLGRFGGACFSGPHFRAGFVTGPSRVRSDRAGLTAGCSGLAPGGFKARSGGVRSCRSGSRSGFFRFGRLPGLRADKGSLTGSGGPPVSSAFCFSYLAAASRSDSVIR